MKVSRSNEGITRRDINRNIWRKLNSKFEIVR
jgi:hypothetical protein